MRFKPSMLEGTNKRQTPSVLHLCSGCWGVPSHITISSMRSAIPELLNCFTLATTFKGW